MLGQHEVDDEFLERRNAPERQKKKVQMKLTIPIIFQVRLEKEIAVTINNFYTEAQILMEQTPKLLELPPMPFKFG